MSQSFNIVAKLQLQAGNFQPVISSLQQQLSGMNATVNIKTNSTSGKSFAAMTNQLAALQNQALSTTQALAGIGKVTAKIGANSNLNNFAKQLGSLSTATNKLQGHIQSATDSMFLLGEQAAVSGRRYLAFGLGAVVFVKFGQAIQSAVSDAIEFQHNMVRLSQLGADSTRSIQAISDTITSLSTATGASSKTLAEMTIYLKGAGLTAREVDDAIKALAKTSLAPTFGDLKNTTEGLISVRSQFDIASKDYEAVLGSINSVAKEFAAESEDLVEAVRRSGAAFRAASGDFQSPQQSLNEFLALFTSVRSTTRESADSIATGFRTIFARLQSNEVSRNLKDIGINLRFTSEEAAAAGQNIEGQFIGGYRAIMRLSEALKGIPTTDPRFSAIVEQIGGLRQVSKVIPLLTQTETAQRAYASALSGTTSLTRDADKSQEAFAVKLARVSEQFSALIREIGQSKTIGKMIDFFTSGAEAATRFVRAIEPLIPLLASLALVKFGVSTGSFTKGFVTQTLNPRNRLATGGVVGGSGHSDSVHTYAQRHSFVIRAPIARKLNKDEVSYLTSEDGSKAGDAVPVSLMPGEIIVPPNRAKKMGSVLSNLNQGYRKRYDTGGVIDQDKQMKMQLLPADYRRWKMMQAMKRRAEDMGLPISRMMAVGQGYPTSGNVIFGRSEKHFFGGFVGGRIRRSLEKQYGSDINFENFAKVSLGANIPFNRLAQFLPFAKGGSQVQFPGLGKPADSLIGHEFAHAGDHAVARLPENRRFAKSSLPYASTIAGHPFNRVAQSARTNLYPQISNPDFYSKQARDEGLDENSLHNVEAFAAAMQAYGQRNQKGKPPASPEFASIFKQIEQEVLPLLAKTSQTPAQVDTKPSLIGRVFGGLRDKLLQAGHKDIKAKSSPVNDLRPADRPIKKLDKKSPVIERKKISYDDKAQRLVDRVSKLIAFQEADLVRLDASMKAVLHPKDTNAQHQDQEKLQQKKATLEKKMSAYLRARQRLNKIVPEIEETTSQETGMKAKDLTNLDKDVSHLSNEDDKKAYLFYQNQALRAGFKYPQFHQALASDPALKHLAPPNTRGGLKSTQIEEILYPEGAKDFRNKKINNIAEVETSQGLKQFDIADTLSIDENKESNQDKFLLAQKAAILKLAEGKTKIRSKDIAAKAALYGIITPEMAEQALSLTEVNARLRKHRSITMPKKLPTYITDYLGEDPNTRRVSDTIYSVADKAALNREYSYEDPNLSLEEHQKHADVVHSVLKDNGFKLSSPNFIASKGRYVATVSPEKEIKTIARKIVKDVVVSNLPAPPKPAPIDDELAKRIKEEMLKAADEQLPKSAKPLLAEAPPLIGRRLVEKNTLPIPTPTLKSDDSSTINNQSYLTSVEALKDWEYEEPVTAKERARKVYQRYANNGLGVNEIRRRLNPQIAPAEKRDSRHHQPLDPLDAKNPGLARLINTVEEPPFEAGSYIFTKQLIAEAQADTPTPIKKRRPAKPQIATPPPASPPPPQPPAPPASPEPPDDNNQTVVPQVSARGRQFFTDDQKEAIRKRYGLEGLQKQQIEVGTFKTNREYVFNRRRRVSQYEQVEREQRNTQSRMRRAVDLRADRANQGPRQELVTPDQAKRISEAELARVQRQQNFYFNPETITQTVKDQESLVRGRRQNYIFNQQSGRFDFAIRETRNTRRRNRIAQDLRATRTRLNDFDAGVTQAAQQYIPDTYQDIATPPQPKIFDPNVIRAEDFIGKEGLYRDTEAGKKARIVRANRLRAVRAATGGAGELQDRFFAGQGEVSLKNNTVSYSRRRKQSFKFSDFSGFLDSSRSPFKKFGQSLFKPMQDDFISPLADSEESAFSIEKAKADEPTRAKLDAAREALIAERGGLVKKKRKRFGKGLSGVGTAGLGAIAIGSQFIPDMIESYTGTFESPGSAGVQGVKTGKQIGGIISGAGQGAAIGSFFGPFGIAIGGAAGALKGFMDATEEATKELRELQVEKIFKKLDSSMDSIISGRLSVAEGVGQIRGESTNLKKIQAESTKVTDNSARNSQIAGAGFLPLALLNATGNNPFTKDGLLGSEGRLQRNILGGEGTLVGRGINNIVGEKGAIGGFFSGDPNLTRKQEFDNNQKFIRENVEPRIGQFRAVNEKIASSIKIDPALLETKDKAGNQLPEAELANRRRQRLSTFYNQGGGELTDTIVRASPGLSIEKYEKEIDRGIIEANRQRIAVEASTRVISQQTAEFEKFSRLADAIQTATVATDNFQRKLDATEAAFGNTLQAIRSQSLVPAVENVGGLDNQSHTRAIDFITSSLRGNMTGPAAGLVSSFGDTSKQVNVLKSSLPEIIGSASKGGFEGEGMRNRVITGVEKIPGIDKDIARRFKDAVDSMSLEDFGKQATNNAGKLAEDLTKSSFANIDDIMKNIAKDLEESSNNFSSQLIKYQSMVSKIGESQDKYANLQVKAIQSQARFRGEIAGHSGGADGISLPTLLAPIQQRQERLTGLKGADANNPNLIGQKLSNTRTQITQKLAERDSAPNQDSQNKAAEELIVLQSSAQRLTQALEDLTQPVEKNAILQEKLNKLDEQRNAKLSYVEKLATADPSQRREMIQNARASDLVMQNGGSLNGINPQIAAKALEHLQSLGEMELPGYGGGKASEIRQQVIRRTALNSGAITPETENKRLSIIGQQAGNDITAAAAQKELVNSQQMLSDNFFNDMKSLQETFFNKLQQSLTEASKKDVIAQIGENNTSLGRAEQASKAQQFFRQQGQLGLTTDQARTAQPSVLDINDLIQQKEGIKTRFPQTVADISNKDSELGKLAGNAFGNTDTSRVSMNTLIEKLTNSLGSGVTGENIVTDIIPQIDTILKKNTGKVTPDFIRNTTANIVKDYAGSQGTRLETSINNKTTEAAQKVFGGNQTTPNQQDAIRQLASQPRTEIENQYRSLKDSDITSDTLIQPTYAKELERAKTLESARKVAEGDTNTKPIISAPVNQSSPITNTIQTQVPGRKIDTSVPSQVEAMRQKAGITSPELETDQQPTYYDNFRSFVKQRGERLKKARAGVKSSPKPIVDSSVDLDGFSKIIQNAQRGNAPEIIDTDKEKNSKIREENKNNLLNNREENKRIRESVSPALTAQQEQQRAAKTEAYTKLGDYYSKNGKGDKAVEAYNMAENFKNPEYKPPVSEKPKVSRRSKNQNQNMSSDGSFAAPTMSETKPAGVNLGQNITDFGGVVNDFNKTISDMTTSVTNLANIFKDLKIPEKISVEQNGQVQVIINGGQLLAALTGDLGNMVRENVMTAMKEQLPGMVKELPA